MSDLRKHYRALGRGERLALYLSACGRGDDAEKAAVVDASPRHRLEAVDFYPEVESVATLALLHVIRQSELCIHLLSLAAGNHLDVERAAEARRVARLYLTAEEAFRSIAEEFGFAVERFFDSPIAPRLSWIRSSGLIERLAGLPGAWPGSVPVPATPTVEEKRREYREALDELISQSRPADL